MKIQRMGRISFKMLLCLLLVSPLLWSCAGMNELREQMEEIENRLDSLETSLNNQIQAFNEFCTGKATISDLSTNKDGSHTITLSDGTKFTVFPKSTEYSTLLTYVEEDGVKYWAMYDAIGSVTALKDAAGNMIPVEAEIPEVVEKDGEYVLYIGDQEFVTGISADQIVTIFTSYELLKDDYDNVYAVTFTFGEDLTFTIPVDGYKGLSFHMEGDINEKVIKDYYVDFGATARVKIKTDDVVDYVMQVPDGWRVKETKNSYTGETFLEVTAPLEAAVEAGAAVAAGDLKIVAVVEGGKSMVAKLELSTEPFKKFTATSTNAIIEKRNGVDKVLYGLLSFADFDKDDILAGAGAMLEANADGVSDTDVNKPLADLLGEELTVGDRYVLWVIPAFYKSEGESAGYYVKEGVIYTQEFGAISASVTVDEDDILFNDVTVSVKLAGFLSYYGGTDVKSATLLSDVVYHINNDMIDPYTDPLEYEGSAFEFPTAAANAGVEIKSEETYVTWIVPVVEGKPTYTVEDVIYKEYTLPGVTSGGSVVVKPGTATVGKVSVSVPLTAEGGSRIYYAWLTKRAASRYGDDAARATYLLSSGTIVEGATATAVVEELDPETDIVLFAMATDAKGKYGSVSVTEYTTEELQYNDLKVTVEVKDKSQNSASLTVKVTGGTAIEYVYWAGRETDEFWTGLSGSNAVEKRTAAQKKIALYPDDPALKRAMTNYPLSNGELVMTDLLGDKNYHVVVLAKDASGEFSEAGFTSFTTLAVNLGTVVRSDDTEWTSVKSQINLSFIPEKYGTQPSGEGAVYAFNASVPSQFTAYILCGSIDYFENNPDTQTMEDMIIYIEDYCSRPYEPTITPSDADGKLKCEPDWVDDNGETHEGSYLNVGVFYTHGYPTNGFATFFAQDNHKEGNCTNWSDGTCATYARQMTAIENRRTLDYYRNYVLMTRGSYCTREDVISKCAEDLYAVYYEIYKDETPRIYINNGSPLYMEHHYGIGKNDQGIVQDMIYVVLKDVSGNYYEPMTFLVEDHYKD